MIYHVLTEAEPFSEQAGGAISRWTGNVLRGDETARIVCARADATWNFPTARIIRVPPLDWYYRVLRLSRGHLPWRYRVSICRAILRPFAARVRAGDVVYIHNRPELVTVFRSLLGKKAARIVLHLHNSHLATYPLTVAAGATADLTLFCSRFLQAEALARFPDLSPTAVLFNGADSALFHPRREAADVRDAPVVLFVGRLVPEKGAHVFVEALRLLQARAIRVRGRILGSAAFGSDTPTAYTRDLRAAATANVEFLPYASGEALAEQFRQASIFCFPSVWNEAFGMVNVEAMASGLPVVATDVGGVAEIFSTGGALLVPPNSGPALADALGTLVQDGKLRARLAAAGYQAFRNRFDWSKVRERYLGLMADLNGRSP